MKQIGIPKGMRDFSPEVMAKRNYIFDAIKKSFKLYGFEQIETPAMENRETLTGKYGEEGDRLIFNVLESGDYLKKVRTSEQEGHVEFAYIVLYLKELLQRFVEGKLKLENVTSKIDHDTGYEGYIPKEAIFMLNDFLREKNAVISSHLEKVIEGYSKEQEIGNSHNFNAVFKAHIIPGLMKYKSTSEEIDFSYENAIQLQPNEQVESISAKALRYDLTVPFARYVVQHQNEISFPFKRFQIQPVWRADRPQRGRYREFYQCDADIIGSDSLLNEVELVKLFDEVLSNLGMKSFAIKLNNRKILSGIAEVIGRPEMIIPITVAIDKLEKIGLEKVNEELTERGLTAEELEKIQPLFKIDGSNEEKLNQLSSYLKDTEIGIKGIEETQFILSTVAEMGLKNADLEVDVTLARGLDYYTGAIFEVVSNEAKMGSICGGGRYADLTGIFGLPNTSGVGVSFGADRIYDVMEELKLFPESLGSSSQLLFINFGEKEASYCLPLLEKLRENNISSELYPDAAKLKKQMKYADQKRIPFVVMIGDEEMQSGKLSLKNMISGEQQKVDLSELAALLKKN